MSPAFFAIYLDDLFPPIRNFGVGCFVGDKFVGAAVFADEIALIASSQGAMKLMLATCEEFAQENNLIFLQIQIPRNLRLSVGIYVEK